MLSGFKLYPRWVPLTYAATLKMSHFGVLLAPFFSSFAHHVGWFVV